MKSTSEKNILVFIITIGVGLSFGGEISERLYWMPPLAFGILRAYVVAGGYQVRDRLGDRGRNITNTWTAIAFICGAVYIYHLQTAGIVTNATMWSLQAVNVMLIPAEVYFSLRMPEHPAIVARREIEATSAALEAVSKADREKIAALEVASKADREKIAALEVRIESAETDSEVIAKELSDQIGRLRSVEKELSDVREMISKPRQLGNMVFSYCSECGDFNSWGIRKGGRVACGGCGVEIVSA